MAETSRPGDRLATLSRDELVTQSSATGCDGTNSFCAEAQRTGAATVLRSDPCAVLTAEEVNDSAAQYTLWMPKYRRERCESSGYVNCAAAVSRFGPAQVAQESLLQGRAQVTSNPGCAGGFVNYLPAADKAKPQAPRDMVLYARPTVLPRSCGTISEVDLQGRLDKLPHAWQGAWAPALSQGRPAAAPKTYGAALKPRQTVTLGTRNKYPEWEDLKTASQPYQDL